ncbi:hypothetical protein CLCR_10949 [Cladophialophora carrionii]|uniref:Uncharacterized protein n=1 Tax=Cladophialophora carrionii TaxID=86049 RepID=A0A1C1CZN4_9EURO|nr:hypothetical protein CLCR_10949 [Cladophialophora carrionii]
MGSESGGEIVVVQTVITIAIDRIGKGRNSDEYSVPLTVSLYDVRVGTSYPCYEDAPVDRHAMPHPGIRETCEMRGADLLRGSQRFGTNKLGVAGDTVHCHLHPNPGTHSRHITSVSTFQFACRTNPPSFSGSQTGGYNVDFARYRELKVTKQYS